MPVIRHGDPTVTQDALTRNQRGLCADCPDYKKCLFFMPRHGGFRNQGPRHVIYRLKTDAAENENWKEDFCSCQDFVAGGLQDRMVTGRQQRAMGLKGEIITIITDRNWCTQGMEMGFNNRNEIVNPHANLVEDLKAAGYKLNLNDIAPAAQFREVTFRRNVPEYRALPKGQSGYSQKIAAEEAQHEAADEQEDAMAWEEHMARTRKPLGTPVKTSGKTIAEMVADDEDK